MNITLAVCCNCGFRVIIAGDGKHEHNASVEYAQEHATSQAHDVWIVKGTRTARAVPVKTVEYTEARAEFDKAVRGRG